ncbi:MAG TPA: DNA repair protein RecO [Gammaproteobacteria bacterium]|nr:DNA repair protein RecO [Gammaproteobacteria bacterium]
MAATSRVQLVPGYVLHQRPYRESSLLLEVFTGPHGRVGLVARGVRAPKSRQRGELQPFRPLRLSWQGRGELGTLTGVEGAAPGCSLQGTALYSAFYLNELLVRLLVRHDPHPRLYTCYQDSLENLAHTSLVEPLLRLFEKNLLQEIGYGLLLDHDAGSGEPVRGEAYYDYHLESGPLLTTERTGPGFIFRGSSLLALARDQLSDAGALRDAKRLMRAALNLYLGDRPLRSRELFIAPGQTGGGL